MWLKLIFFLLFSNYIISSFKEFAFEDEYMHKNPFQEEKESRKCVS